METIAVSIETIEGSMEPIEVVIQSIEVSMEPIGVPLRGIEVSVQPIEVAIRGIEVSMQPIGVAIQSIEVSMEPIGIVIQRIEISMEPIGIVIQRIEISIQPIQVASRSIEVSMQPIEGSLCPIGVLPRRSKVFTRASGLGSRRSTPALGCARCAVHAANLRFGSRTVFEDLTLTVEEGERVGLVGINGSGKSSLMKMLARELVPDSGELMLRRGARVEYLPQEPTFPEGATIESELTVSDPELKAALAEHAALSAQGHETDAQQGRRARDRAGARQTAEVAERFPRPWHEPPVPHRAAPAAEEDHARVQWESGGQVEKFFD